MAELGGPLPRGGVEDKVARDVRAAAGDTDWIKMIIPDDAAPEVVAGNVVLWSHGEGGGEAMSEIGRITAAGGLNRTYWVCLAQMGRARHLTPVRSTMPGNPVPLPHDEGPNASGPASRVLSRVLTRGVTVPGQAQAAATMCETVRSKPARTPPAETGSSRRAEHCGFFAGRVGTDFSVQRGEGRRSAERGRSNARLHQLQPRSCDVTVPDAA
jgi:hypothetical protein